MRSTFVTELKWIHLCFESNRLFFLIFRSQKNWIWMNNRVCRMGLLGTNDKVLALIKWCNRNRCVFAFMMVSMWTKRTMRVYLGNVCPQTLKLGYRMTKSVTSCRVHVSEWHHPMSMFCQWIYKWPLANDTMYFAVLFSPCSQRFFCSRWCF